MRNAMLMQMIQNIDDLWSEYAKDLTTRLDNTERLLTESNETCKQLRADMRNAQGEREAAVGELAAAKQQVVQLLAEKEEFQEQVVRAEQAAVAATIECHNLQEEIGNVGTQQQAWQSSMARKQDQLQEELRRSRVELRQSRQSSKQARVEALRLRAAVERMREGPAAREGDGPEAGSRAGGGRSANRHLLDMTGEERLRAAVRHPASTVFEFRPKRRAPAARKGRDDRDDEEGDPGRDSVKGDPRTPAVRIAPVKP